MQEAMEYAALRQGLYRAHAALFLDPRVHGEQVLDALEALLAGPGAEYPFSRGLRQVRVAFSEAGPADVERTFMRLLQTTSTRFGAPPFASEYLGGQAGIAGLEAVYRQAGIRPSAGARIDHLSVLLEAAAIMVGREIEAIQAEDLEAACDWQAKTRALVQEHILSWLPRFQDRVVLNDPGPFEAAVASVNAFLHHDAASLAVTEEKP